MHTKSPVTISHVVVYCLQSSILHIRMSDASCLVDWLQVSWSQQR